MTSPLFERLGGAPAIEAAVDIFYKKVLADSELAPYFSDVKMMAQVRQQIRFFTTALGGPADYTGRDMKEAHAGLGVTSHHFDLVAGHLVATLAELGVSQDLIDEVVAAEEAFAS